MADKKKKGMTKEQLLKDAELEVDLPKKYIDPKPGSTERPIPRTARRDFIRNFVVEGEGPVPKKYLDYADQEAREAAAGERREARGMKKGGAVKKKSVSSALNGPRYCNAWQDPWEDGVVMAKEIYEILGRPVTKEQYEAAAKKMDAPQSEAEKEMDDFAKRARERAAQRKLEKTAMGKKKGGMVSSASKRADGIAIKGKTKGRFV
jgi:hypothetical protein